MISEYEKQIRDKLFELMRDNPDLPIHVATCREIKPKSTVFDYGTSIRCPLVADIVAGRGVLVCKLDVYADDYMREALRELYADPHRFDEYTEKEVRAAFDALPWKKVIIIPI